MNPQFSDIVEAVTEFRQIAASDFQVDASLRFESAPDAGDGSNFYAISDKRNNNKGLLIDAFDVLDKECSRELFERLASNRQTSYDHGEEIPMRYGPPISQDARD